jgi:Raf kinase inhibitor-like YbhB/YbcL family protein
MRHLRLVVVLVLVLGSVALATSVPPTDLRPHWQPPLLEAGGGEWAGRRSVGGTEVAGAWQQPSGNASPAAPAAQPGGRGGRGGGRGGVQVMTLSSTAWADGGQIPTNYSQVGQEASPALAWTNVPDGTQSFVLIFHDLDAAIGNGTDDILHWMLWNIPAATRSLPEGVPQASQLPDGTRQISASGPYYRGPGAPASGPAHHYVFELFALDTTIDSVPAVGQSPPATRAAIVAAMAGHIRGKAVYTGLFKR